VIFGERLFPGSMVTALLAASLSLEPDFGTSLMLAVTFVVVVYAAGARLSHLAMAAAPALAVAAGLLIFVPWRNGSARNLSGSWADPQKTGFQVVQSLIAVGSGGPNGLGFAEGKQKMLVFAVCPFGFHLRGYW